MVGARGVFSLEAPSFYFSFLLFLLNAISLSPYCSTCGRPNRRTPQSHSWPKPLDSTGGSRRVGRPGVCCGQAASPLRPCVARPDITALCLLLHTRPGTRAGPSHALYTPTEVRQRGPSGSTRSRPVPLPGRGHPRVVSCPSPSGLLSIQEWSLAERRGEGDTGLFPRVLILSSGEPHP